MVQSQHLSTMLDPGHIMLSDAKRFFSFFLLLLLFKSAHCLLSLANLTDPEVKGTKHLAPYQSFIVHHSPDHHIWAKGGMRRLELEIGVCTAASRSYCQNTRSVSPGAAALTGITLNVCSEIILVWCVITKCGHLLWGGGLSAPAVMQIQLVSLSLDVCHGDFWSWNFYITLLHSICGWLNSSFALISLLLNAVSHEWLIN